MIGDRDRGMPGRTASGREGLWARGGAWKEAGLPDGAPLCWERTKAGGKRRGPRRHHASFGATRCVDSRAAAFPAMSLQSGCSEPNSEAGLAPSDFARCCDTDGRLTLEHQAIFEQFQHHRLKVLGDCEPGVLEYDLVLLGQFASQFPGP